MISREQIAQYEETLYKSNKHLRNGDICILGRWSKSGYRVFLEVGTQYGACKVSLDSLRQGGSPSPLTAVNRLDYEKKELCDKSEAYCNGDFCILSDLIREGKYYYIIIGTEFGKCKVRVANLKSGKVPGVKTALNKDHFLRRQLWKYSSWYRNPENDVISVMTKRREYVILQDRHGKLRCTINNLLRDKVPTRQSAVNFISYLQSQSDEVHKGRYEILIDQNRAKNGEKVKINCKKHGEFLQSIGSHLSGSGCPVCWEEDNRFNNSWAERDPEGPASLYLIICYGHGEHFLKVGVTSTTVEERFSDKDKMPYKYIILDIIRGTRKAVHMLEQNILCKNKENRHYPKVDFPGATECLNIGTNIKIK